MRRSNTLKKKECNENLLLFYNLKHLFKEVGNYNTEKTYSTHYIREQMPICFIDYHKLWVRLILNTKPTPYIYSGRFLEKEKKNAAEVEIRECMY